MVIIYLQFRSPFGWEFTMEYDNIAFRSLWNNFWCFSLSIYKLVHDFVMCVQVGRSANVATFEFVWITAIDDFERCNVVIELALQQFGHGFGRNWFQVAVATLDQWQAEWFAEIADEIWFGRCCKFWNKTKIEKLVKLLEFVSADEWIKSIHLIFVVVE